MKMIGMANQNTEHAEHQHIRQNTAEHGRTPVYRGMLIAIGAVIMALTFCRTGAPASAQITTPTPLPQVVATKQAADSSAAKVGDLQAQRAQTEARLAEINKNIETQIAEAERAAADARNAAATQNAVEEGAAIGRLEGAIAQLRASYAGKDEIITELTARTEQQAEQSAADKRAIDRLTVELQQARNDKQTAINAYNAVTAQQRVNQQNDMVNSAVKLIVALSFLSAVLVFAAFVIQRRRAPVVVAPTDTAPDVTPPIDADYTIEE